MVTLLQNYFHLDNLLNISSRLENCSHKSMKDPSALKAVLPLVVFSAADWSGIGEREVVWGQSPAGERSGAVVGEGRVGLREVVGRLDFLTGVEVW